MKIASILILIASIIISSIYFITGYQSAFEADQACHALMNNGDYKYKINSLGCDHDIETRQWIFYEKNNPSTAAKVIKRFRY